MIYFMLKYPTYKAITQQVNVFPLYILKSNLDFFRSLNKSNILIIRYASFPSKALFNWIIKNLRVDHSHKLFIHEPWMIPIGFITKNEHSQMMSHLRGCTGYWTIVPKTLNISLIRVKISKNITRVFIHSSIIESISSDNGKDIGFET